MASLGSIDQWIYYSDSPLQPIHLGLIPASSLIIGLNVFFQSAFGPGSGLYLNIGYEDDLTCLVIGDGVSDFDLAGSSDRRFMVLPPILGLSEQAGVGYYVGKVTTEDMDVLITWPNVEGLIEGAAHIAVLFVEAEQLTP
jgi:hypothetical protein